MNTRKRPFSSSDLFLSRPNLPPQTHSRSLLSSSFASPFTSQSAYQAHHSCVNALAISPGQGGRWLASGGDDKRVILLDALANDEDGIMPEPRAWYRGAQSNIFALDFSCDGSKIYSTGNDTMIICHDLETGSTSEHSTSTSTTSSETPGGPSEIWIDNDDSIHGLACHPANPHLFLSASSDGTLRQYDTRTTTNAVGIIADAHEMEDIQFHPLQHDLFAYAGEDAHAGLIDSRMAWTELNGTRRGTKRLARDIAVVNYHADLVRSPKLPPSTPLPSPVKTQRSRPAVSSLSFSPTGSLVSLTLSGHVPTLYSLSSAEPLAALSARSPSPSTDPLRPGFPMSYQNACTTKHGSFGGGPNAEEGKGLWYACGSDDFGIYVWEVPSRETMERGRSKEGFSGEVWPSSREGIAYLEPATNESREPNLHFPYSVSQPSSILRAHRSIPNTTLFHPTLPHLYSCGVEKLIIRHSPTLTSKNSSSSPRVRRSTSPDVGSWSFSPRPPTTEPTSTLSALFGPTDPALDPNPLPGESHEARERRLRREDLEVLEYFDELILGESDTEGFWRDDPVQPRKRGSLGLTTGFDSDSDESSDGRSTDDEERIEREGDEGTTRRMLRRIYALEEADGGSSDEGESDDE